MDQNENHINRCQRKCRILFVEARDSKDLANQRMNPNMSLYILATFLQDNVPDCDFAFTFTTSDVFPSLTEWEFDICGIYATSQAWSEACRVARDMRDAGILTLIGGPHISSMPESLTEDFALGCVGPGEDLLREVVETFLRQGRISQSDIDGLASAVYHGPDHTVKVNRSICTNRSMDSCPSAYKYFLKPNIIRTNLISSQGCPHSCYYCSAKIINPVVRFHSAERIVEEIVCLYEKHGVGRYKFIDDNLLASRSRLEKITRLLGNTGLLGRIAIDCTSCSKLINNETAGLLKLLGARNVTIGFESGSSRILSRLKGARITLDDHQRAIECLRQRGIRAYGNFLVGTPGEERQDIEQTFSFIRNNPLSVVDVNFIKPLPGTPFWNELVESGRIDPDSVDFGELSLSSCDKKWYFNECLSFEETIRLYKKLRRLCVFRTLRCNLVNPILYQVISSQLKTRLRLLGEASVFKRDNGAAVVGKARRSIR